jgi:hypothetical protein
MKAHTYPKENANSCTSLLDPVDIANSSRTYSHPASASERLNKPPEQQPPERH